MTGITAITTTSSVLQQIVPCSSNNSSNQPCISRNNVSTKTKFLGFKENTDFTLMNTINLANS